MDKNKRADLINELRTAQIEFLENKCMSSYSSIKIGGAAELIVFPKNERELLLITGIFRVYACGYYVIGRGTNTLFKDKNICLPVISFKQFEATYSESKKSGSEMVLGVGSGAVLSKVLKYAIENNFGGCEFFYGIPGTLGGAVKMNAGSKESVIGNIVEKIDIIMDGGTKLTVEKGDLEFSYRNLKIRGVNSDYFITNVHLTLFKSLRAKISENIEIFKKRKSLQPLSEYSLGCIFRNPEGLSAGRVIEEIGFKGFSNGGVQVSEKHANFIVNKGSAKPDDIMSLIKIIQEKALSSRGIELNTEIKII